MVDHHVDRPEVEAGQPAQLTGTNRSIGFEHPHPAARTRGSDIRVQSSEFRVQSSDIRTEYGAFWKRHRVTTRRPAIATAIAAAKSPSRFAARRTAWGCARGSAGAAALGRALAWPKRRELWPGALDGLVAIARGKTPDPIPNSAVKTLSDDGTPS